MRKLIKVKLEEITKDIFSGGTPNTRNPHYWDGGIPWLSSGETRSTFIDKTEKTITQLGVDNSSTRKAIIGDIVIASAGQGHTRGQASLCKIDTFINQSVVAIRPDNEKVNAIWLFYNLRSRYEELRQISDSHSIRGSLTTKLLKGLEITLPPKEHQKEMGEFLLALDEKMELNLKTNKLLRDISLILFKSWFVDFDPVLDKTVEKGGAVPNDFKERLSRRMGLDRKQIKLPDKIYDLFPSKFKTEGQYSIPIGWEVENFGNLLDFAIGGDWGKEKPDDKHSEKVVIVRGTDIPNINNGNDSKVPIRFVSKSKMQKRLLRNGDIIIEVSGGSPSQPTGRSLLMTSILIDRLGGKVEPASFCRLFRPRKNTMSLILSLHLLKIYEDGKMWNYQNQSTGISNFQTKEFLKNEKVVIPSNAVIECFNSIVDVLYKRIYSPENMCLSKMRDVYLNNLV